MTFQEIKIIATGPCITNQLRDVNTTCRGSWYIAAHIWKIYDIKIEVIPFIINFSTELTTVILKKCLSSVLSPFMAYNRGCNKNNTKGATCGAATAYPSRAPEIKPILARFVLFDL